MNNVQSHYQPSGQIGYAWFAAMHSRIDIVLRGCAAGDFERYIKTIYSRVLHLDKCFNRFDPESELSLVNDCAHVSSVRLSDDLFKILELSLEARITTGGLFDVTVQSPVACLPGDMLLDQRERSIRFLREGLQIDLGGIAKGYAADEIAAYLSAKGVTHFMLSFGNSTIVARGNQPGGEGWKIALQDGGKQFVLKNECLSVSGNRHQPEGHIIHPDTGVVMKGELQKSVVTSSAVEGEIAVTVACLQHSEK